MDVIMENREVRRSWRERGAYLTEGGRWVRGLKRLDNEEENKMKRRCTYVSSIG